MYLKACKTMFMVFNGHQLGDQKGFLFPLLRIFQKFKIWSVWWTILGQNLPKKSIFYLFALGFFFESIYSHVYGVQLSLWRFLLTFFFRFFLKFKFWAVWRPILGQNLPQIWKFHKVGGDLSFMGSRKDLMRQMGSQGRTQWGARAWVHPQHLFGPLKS